MTVSLSDRGTRSGRGRAATEQKLLAMTEDVLVNLTREKLEALYRETSRFRMARHGVAFRIQDTLDQLAGTAKATLAQFKVVSAASGGGATLWLAGCTRLAGEGIPWFSAISSHPKAS